MQIAILPIILVATTASAQDMSQKLPFDPTAIEGKLPNGLTYYVRQNHKPENKVELRLVVKAGSILEDNDQQGLAHFMEHMNFNGTTHFVKNDLVSYLQSIGVEFGADLNAYTSFDETVYILPIPTDKPGNLEKGFQIIEDWAHNALLTDTDIDQERGVVLEESRLGKGADERMLKKYFPKLTEGTRYADRLPIGKDDILKTFKHETIRRFYRDWYRPDLQAVMVVGDIDTGTAMNMIRQHFAGLNNPAGERDRFYVDVKPRTKSDAMVVTDKEAMNSSLQILFPFYKKTDETTLGDYRNINIKRQLVFSMINRHLNDLAQSGNPPFPFAQAYFNDMIHGYESFSVYTVFSNDGPQKALNAVAAELLRSKQYGFTQSDLDLAKKDLMAEGDKFYNERTTTDSKDYIDEFIRGFLNNEPIPGVVNEYGYYKEMIPTVQLAEINGMVKDWMANMNTFALVTGPAKSEVKMPTDAQLLTMTQDAFKQEVKPAEEKQIASSLMATKPTPGKVVSQRDEEGLGATTYTLSNGIKVTIKPTDFKSDEILVNAVKNGGTNSYNAADQSNCHFATEAVQAMGVGDFTPNDLDKVIAGKPIKVNLSMDNIKDVITASSNVNDFESMLQLVNLYITQPRKDADLFKAYKDKQKTQMQFFTSNPTMAFIDTAVRTLYNNNPLESIIIPRASDYDKLDLDRSFEIYKNEFSSADGYHFFIVGNVKPEVAIPLLETYLGSIPSANKAPIYKDNGVRPIAGVHKFDLKKGQEKQSMIFAEYYGDAPFSEDLSLKAQTLAEILNIKVVEDLREKMGDIYAGQFYANVTKEPYEHYSIGLQLPCGPENVDKLLTAASDEINMIKKNGPEAKDLDKVKNQFHEKHIVNMKDNKYWTQRLENVLVWGRDRNHILNYDEWINKMTPADIQQTANQLFNNKNEFTSVLYPETQHSDKDRNTN